MASRITVAGIRAEGRHGANPGERDSAQPFVVDLDVVVEAGGDSLEDTVDYRVLAELVRAAVASSSFVLLENVAEAAARAVFDLPLVLEVTAVVHKPMAALAMGVDDVSAEVTLG
ncbi:MAG TPA: dihydroneopterin aldolase [Actinobacteria bacterium]|jgi:dihydroneopterin aldolase|nr:dihydroneopterin aldolase [Actinomycetota bacterium]HCP62238.1 dihydroneopterin aldolase [Actinomycetota bacterium]